MIQNIYCPAAVQGVVQGVSSAVQNISVQRRSKYFLTITTFSSKIPFSTVTDREKARK
jgi:hypothetical protein